MRHNSTGLFPILSNKDSWENRVMMYGNTSAQVNTLLVLSSRKIIEVVMQETSHIPTLLWKQNWNVWILEYNRLERGTILVNDVTKFIFLWVTNSFHIYYSEGALCVKSNRSHLNVETNNFRDLPLMVVIYFSSTWFLHSIF